MINPSLIANNPSASSTKVNNNDKIKTKAEQMVLDTERSFSRILGQLLDDRENSNSFSSPSIADLPNLPNLPMFDFINNPMPPIQFDKLPTNVSHATMSSSALQSTNDMGQAEKLNRVLGGKLKGAGDLFAAAGKKYGVNPALLASISVHETGNGSSRAANERNNISGTMTSNGLKNYSTIEESIMDMARNIRENYLNKGLHTIQDIGKKYAPVGAANDPTNLNQFWVNQVTKNFKTFSV